METVMLDMTEAIDSVLMKRAGSILRQGGLVAFPTETVYGLGANALDEHAAARIYAAKGRPSDNPLIVHIAKIEDLETIAAEIPENARKLAKAFWPGPLTMIFRKKAIVPYGTTGGLDTVAVRMPDHPVALALIEAGGGFIAAPSANTSGRPSPTRAAHVADDLAGAVEMIIDGGDVGIGLESTIVDLTEGEPVILRPGYINETMLEQVIGAVHMDPALLMDDPQQRPKAPGMKYRHYAPRASLTIVEGRAESVVDRINHLVEEDLQAGRRAGIIATEETAGCYGQGIVKAAGTRRNEITIAARLYSILREFDDLEVDRIYSEAFETPQMGHAIMNRLIKAAGHQILNV